MTDQIRIPNISNYIQEIINGELVLTPKHNFITESELYIEADEAAAYIKGFKIADFKIADLRIEFIKLCIICHKLKLEAAVKEVEVKVKEVNVNKNDVNIINKSFTIQEKYYTQKISHIEGLQHLLMASGVRFKIDVVDHPHQTYKSIEGVEDKQAFVNSINCTRSKPKYSARYAGVMFNPLI